MLSTQFPPHGLARPAGLSLLEIVLCAAILAVVVVALSRAHIAALATTRQVEEHQAAAQAARNMLETIIKDQFPELLGVNGQLLHSEGKFREEILTPTGLAFPTKRRHPFVVYLNSWSLDVKLDNPGGYSDTATTFYLINRDANDFLRPGVELGYPQTSEKMLITAVTVGADNRVFLDVARGQGGTSAQPIPEGAHLFPLIDYLPGLVDEYAGEIIFITDETRNNADYGGDLSPNDGVPDGVRSYQQYPIDLNDNGDDTEPGEILDLNVDGDADDTDPILDESAIKIPVGIVIRWNGKFGEERHETWTVLTRY